MKALGLTSFAAVLLVGLAAQGGDDAVLKKEKAALEGAWKIVSRETLNSKGAPPGSTVWEFGKDGKSLTTTKDGKATKGTFTLNPAGKPKEIDIMLSKDKTVEGIYQIEKDTLKLCFATNPGDGRPTEFAPKEGKAYVVLTLERAK